MEQALAVLVTDCHPGLGSEMCHHHSLNVQPRAKLQVSKTLPNDDDDMNSTRHCPHGSLPTVRGEPRGTRKHAAFLARANSRMVQDEELGSPASEPARPLPLPPPATPPACPRLLGHE